MNGMAAVLGPNFGSFLLDWTGSWHWLFLINLPIAVLLVVFGACFIAETKAPEAKRLDTAGIFLLSLSILAVMYGMTNLDAANLLNSLGDPEVYGCIVFGILCFAALISFEKRVEMRGRSDFGVFSAAEPHISAHAYHRFVIRGLLAAVIFIPSYVEQYLGVPAAKAGYWMTPLALASGIGAWLGGALTDKKDR